MPRPKNKQELLSASKLNYEKLIQFIGSLSNEKLNQEFNAEFLNRNIKDVIAHLHHWNLMVTKWHDDSNNGIKPDIPAKGYTWKTLPELNLHINKMYKDNTIIQALVKFIKSYQKVMEIIESYSNEQLFTKKLYPWTGSTSMGAYFISSTSSHLVWALKLIKKNIKT